VPAHFTEGLKSIIGVDFSGARLAGANAWLATVDLVRGHPKRLRSLENLGKLAGSDHREEALAHLASRISGSAETAWAIDFPFALPIEVVPAGATFDSQLRLVQEFSGDAREFGRACVDRAKQIGTVLHIRRLSDRDARTPFDCYHYRIIYQTFHGMRDVLAALRPNPAVAVLPFDAPTAGKTLVVEACPGSTLRRLGLPFNRYKYTGAGPIPAKLKPNRTRLIRHVCEAIEVSPADKRIMERNAGGDAIDAVYAALGGWHGLVHADWPAKHADPRIRAEGWIAF
jgi:hypothetical protein